MSSPLAAGSQAESTAHCTEAGNDAPFIGALLLLSAVPFVHLMAVPPFVDEGAQLQQIWRLLEVGDWTGPLGYGKPLEVWPMVPLLHVGIQPLAAIRALHVLSGMLSTVLTYFLARRLTNRRCAFTSGVLFAICPFVVYLQRLALSDILLCTASLWVLLSAARFLEAPTWKRAAALAAALLTGAFCKFPVGFVFLISMPLALMLMPRGLRRTLLEPPVLGRLLAAHAPAIAVTLLVFVTAGIRMQRGQVPGFGLQDLILVGAEPGYDIAAAIGVPRPTLAGELAAQLSWPVMILALVGLAVSACQQDWRQRWLLATGMLPLLAIGLIPKFWYSRYLLFCLPPLIICSVLGWQVAAARAPRFARPVAIAVLAVCVGLMGWQSALLVFQPAAARWSALDRFQYFEGWTSGFGFPQAAQFILAARTLPAMIYSLDCGAYQLRNYLPRQFDGRVSPLFYGPEGAFLGTEAARLQNLLDHAPAWIVASRQLLPGQLVASVGAAGSDRVELRQIAQFNKPGSRGQLAVYEAIQR